MSKQEVCKLLIRYEQPLALLGLLYLGIFGAHLLGVLFAAYRGLRHYVLPQLFPYSDFRSKYGDWAVVMILNKTSLGEFYALQLAKKKMNIYLIGTDVERLKNTRRQIRKECVVLTEILVLSFHHYGNGDIEEIFECVKGKLNDINSIGVLVNQMIPPIEAWPHELVLDSDFHEYYRSIYMTTQVTKVVVAKMKPAGRGAIVNINTSCVPYPRRFPAVHGAANTYMDFLSRGLFHELRHVNIQVQSLLLDHQTGDNVIAHAVNTLPVANRSRGHWILGLQEYLSSWVPLSWREYWGNRNRQLNIRRDS